AIPKSFPKESLVNAEQGIKVDISGAVNSPGVYSLPSSARVEDAIKTAGGFSETANGGYISKSLNLSQKLSDGQKIYIPVSGENTGGVVAGTSTTTSGGKIGIN